MLTILQMGWAGMGFHHIAWLRGISLCNREPYHFEYKDVTVRHIVTLDAWHSYITMLAIAQGKLHNEYSHLIVSN